jgi:hypothetical protein
MSSGDEGQFEVGEPNDRNYSQQANLMIVTPIDNIDETGCSTGTKITGNEEDESCLAVATHGAMHERDAANSIGPDDTEVARDEEHADDEEKLQGPEYSEHETNGIHEENHEHEQQVGESEKGSVNNDEHENIEQAEDKENVNEFDGNTVSDDLPSAEDVKHGFESQREKVDTLIKQYYERVRGVFALALDIIPLTRILSLIPGSQDQLVEAAEMYLGKQEQLLGKFTELSRSSRNKRAKFEDKCKRVA